MSFKSGFRSFCEALAPGALDYIRIYMTPAKPNPQAPAKLHLAGVLTQAVLRIDVQRRARKRPNLTVLEPLLGLTRLTEVEQMVLLRVLTKLSKAIEAKERG